MTRPYFTSSIAELESIFEKSVSDRKALVDLKGELGLRSTERSDRLREKVIAAMHALSRKGRAEEMPPANPGDALRVSLEAFPESGQDGPLPPATARTSPGSRPDAKTRDIEGETSRMPATGELERLSVTYEKLRERLLDMTLRNPMLSYKHRPTSKRQLQVVDEVPEEMFKLLAVEGASLEVVPLPEPDDVPQDEKTDEFNSALSYGKATDVTYLEALQEIEASGRDDGEAALAKAERALRDRLRAELSLPASSKAKSVDPVQHARDLGIDPSFELPASSKRPEHRDRRIQTLKYPKSLDAVLEKLRDDARLAEQETGLSTLFLVFGFLEWTEADGGTKLIAPLLMLPVRLEARQSTRGKTIYEVTATATVAEDNLSLRKRIERDFGILLPEVETDVDTTLSVEAHLTKIAEAVEHQRGWRIRRQITLGHFVFGRFAMYADLDPARWSQHPVEDGLVGPVIRGTDGSGNTEAIFGGRPDHRIDDPLVEARAPFLIHDADASQHSALVDAMDGQHIVIQGPPGTGKSQTITNLIANAMAAGKTVLFLAEKQAALDVVKRRLDIAGLGEFCLELHSDRATPKKVIEHLKERFAVQQTRTAPGLPDTTLARARGDVSTYVDALHSQSADGATPFGLIWKAIRSRSDVGDPLDRFGGIEIPQAQLQRLAEVPEARDAVRLYARIAHEFETAFGSAASSPWCGLDFATHVTPGTARDLVEDLRPLRERVAAVVHLLGDVQDLEISGAAELRHLVSAASALPAEEPVPAMLDAFRGGPTKQAKAYLLERSREFDLARRSAIHPLPRGLSEETFPLVERLDALAPDDDRLPRQVLAEASESKDGASRLKEALAGAEPFMRALGFGSNFPCEGLNALMLAAFAVGQLPEELRRWFAWSPAGNFRSAYDVWKDLVSFEATWRGRFPRAETPWPLADDLRSTAQLLRKGWLSRAMDLGAGKKAIALAGSRLGTDLVPGRADDLEKLAAHVEALHAFVANHAYAQIMGEQWQGLNTPFEAAARGQSFRKAALDRIREYPFGQEVAEALAGVDEAELARTALVAPGLALLRAMPDGVAKLSGPADRALSELERRRDENERVLAVDPGGALSAIDVPLASAAKGVEIARQRRVVEERLAAIDVRSELDKVVGSDTDLAAAEDAFGWIDRVSPFDAYPAIHRSLLSSDVRPMVDRVRSVSQQAATLFERLEDALGSLRNRYGLTGLDPGHPQALSQRLDTLLPRKDEFAEFVDLRRQRNELAKLGLESFVARAEQEGIDPRLLPQLFDGLLAKNRAAALRRADPVLSQAAGTRIQSRREAFIQADRAKIVADRASVRQVLAGKRPLRGSSHGSKKTWTEYELLFHEVGKQQRFVPIRDLMRRASASLQSVTPCFMMSPLSLAKFLPRGRVKFDLLVIDEASQMRPEDALGGLLRAKQVVVVGDQKQLPPSDFFHRSGGGDTSAVEDEEGSDDIDDESILEACAKTFRSTRMLRWHYRSRCESLIAFSNREFYKGDLITFPSSRPRSFSVDLVRVQGRYEARRNPFEAQVVAEEAILFMRHHAEEHDVPSLGIVTVNGDQRDLIDEEIKRLSSDDEVVQRYRERVAEKGEPFFVKNLENVQGDERDFIFVSMTYGPSAVGVPMHQRFGPIAGKQGHRRLNVLFTRARLRIALFASFGSADVRPGDTSAEGVRVLKRYFEYAERGGYAEVAGDAEADSDFEIEVARRLTQRGFQVDHQVGVSGFRIDLGVRHPDHPERFIAGIECDGAAYHSSKSARDRDRLREDILTGLGWNILRVWSTDWFDNPDLQTEHLVKRLDALKETSSSSAERYKIALTQSGSPPEQVQSDADTVDQAEINDQVAGTAADDATSAMEASQGTESFFEDHGPLSEGELRSALRAFRDTVIATEMTDWEDHRSILRETMIETFVAQQVDDPGDWFKLVPTFQRSGTNPVEKRLYLERICGIVGRLEKWPKPAAPPFVLKPTEPPDRTSQGSLFQGVGAAAPIGRPVAVDRTYRFADVRECGVEPQPERFYDAAYRPALARMTSHVIETEGPIFVDQVVTRVARAHGFRKDGGRIVEAVLKAVDGRYCKTREDGREVIWPAEPVEVVPFRKANGVARDLEDVPVVELASLAAPFVARKVPEEDILTQLRDRLGLGRLREPTRKRFLAAISAAREAGKPG